MRPRVAVKTDKQEAHRERGGREQPANRFSMPKCRGLVEDQLGAFCSRIFNVR